MRETTNLDCVLVVHDAAADGQGQTEPMVRVKEPGDHQTSGFGGNFVILDPKEVFCVVIDEHGGDHKILMCEFHDGDWQFVIHQVCHLVSNFFGLLFGLKGKKRKDEKKGTKNEEEMQIILTE